MRTLTFDEQMELNRAAYERVREEIRRRGAGHYVAIASGRLLAITDDFPSAAAAIEALQPAPEHFLVFPSDAEPIFDVVESLDIAVFERIQSDSFSVR